VAAPPVTAALRSAAKLLRLLRDVRWLAVLLPRAEITEMSPPSRYWSGRRPFSRAVSDDIEPRAVRAAVQFFATVFPKLATFVCTDCGDVAVWVVLEQADSDSSADPMAIQVARLFLMVPPGVKWKGEAALPICCANSE
jgi:hypothetical protein